MKSNLKLTNNYIHHKKKKQPSKDEELKLANKSKVTFKLLLTYYSHPFFMKCCYFVNRWGN